MKKVEILGETRFPDIGEIMEAEVRLGRRWLENADRNLREADDILRAAKRKARLGDESAVSALREACELWKKCADERTFYDGVLAGLLLMQKAIGERAVMETLDGIKKK